jgi:hypothetical protein
MVVSGAALLAASTAMASPIQPEMNSIADSWHNLGANNRKGGTPNDPGNGTPNQSDATGEICVFCHTPHGGDTSAAVPLWNRQLGAPGDYIRYSANGTTTFDAEEGDIGSVTLACLSCHDGAQAIDALLNAPGSGNYYAPGSSTEAQRREWSGVAMSGSDVGGDSRLLPGIVQNLGQDLSNDHPVSMQYAGGGFAGVDGVISGTPRDLDFTTQTPRTITKADASTYDVFLDAEASGNSSINTVFWIERGTESQNSTARDRSDVIFYTRNFTSQAPGGANGFQPFVECGSCHDPHNVDNPTFLRVSNGIAGDLVTTFPLAEQDAASGLCLTCHDK